MLRGGIMVGLLVGRGGGKKFGLGYHSEGFWICILLLIRLSIVDAVGLLMKGKANSIRWTIL